ncbi:DUF4389 domain-containing protein [Bacteroidota bacterium]
MELSVKHQEKYSRGELLLRTFFGWIYIGIPHFFLLFFIGLWSGILAFVSWWAILFTGRYPQSFFEFQVKTLKWSLRVAASLFNLVDGFPPFGLNTADDTTKFEMPYPESLGRGTLLLKTFLGWIYCGIPHGFCLSFRYLWSYILGFIAWWAVLFTGKYPESWHEFNVGTLRWTFRFDLYLYYFMSDDYPPFSGK